MPGTETSWSQKQPDGSYAGSIPIPDGQTYDFGYSAADEGSDTLEFKVSDGQSTYYTSPQSITITDSPISFQSAVGGASATEGQSASVFLGVLLDPDYVGGDYSQSTIDWGDGTSSSLATFSDASVDAHGNQITQGSGRNVYGSHTYTEDGTYTAALTLVDDGGQSIAGSTTIQVGDAPISVSGGYPTATEGQAFSNTVIGTVTDQNPNATAADFANSTIDWGDGTATSTPAFQAVSVQPGVFNILGSHT